MVGTDGGQHTRRVLAGIPDHQYFCMCEKHLHVIAHERRDMWNLFLDVTAVGPYQSRNRNVRVENSHVQALADEYLNQRHHGTLSEVICPGFEGQTYDSHPPLSCLEHCLYSSANLCLVGGQDSGQQRE